MKQLQLFVKNFFFSMLCCYFLWAKH